MEQSCPVPHAERGVSCVRSHSQSAFLFSGTTRRLDVWRRRRSWIHLIGESISIWDAVVCGQDTRHSLSFTLNPQLFSTKGVRERGRGWAWRSLHSATQETQSKLSAMPSNSKTMQRRISTSVSIPHIPQCSFTHVHLPRSCGIVERKRRRGSQKALVKVHRHARRPSSAVA